MKLILPSVEYKKSFLEALEEFHAEGNELSYDAKEIDDNFDAFIKNVQERIRGVDPERAVPDTLFWLVDDGKFIGRVSLRHELNDRLKRYGGHIGYYIRPTERKKGYGLKALELALPEAKKLGLKKVLVTCDENNPASLKIIEKCGGVLQDITTPDENDNKPLMRWWITL